MSQYLSEAFKKLDILNEDTFTINDNGLEDFVKFEEDDEFEDSIDVIDPDAETEEDLQDSYVGKVILDCCVCHSKIYKDVEDVVIEDDIANANEECPFCYTTDGYKVIGQVAAFGEEDNKKAIEDEAEETKEDKDLEESLLPTPPVPNVGGLLEDEEKELDEFMDANITLDAKGFGGKDNNVSVLSGKLPFGKDKEVEEGFLGIKTKKEKEKEKQRAAQKARLDAYYKEQEEKDRLAKEWQDWVKTSQENGERNARRAEAEKQAKQQAERDRYKNIKSSNVSNTGKAGVHYSGGDYYSEELTESVNNVNVETDEDVINVATDDNGKVTVTTEPKETFVDSEEVITPVEPEVQSEINDNVEDGGEIEIDMDEFDEESFDELGEGYLKKVYENVNSFKTSNVSMIKDKLVLEGVINFTSGKSKKTNFVFGIREATKSGKVRFIGENKEIARGRKSFTITGRVDNKKFLSESLNYNYGVKGVNGKAQRLYGTVKRGK